MARHCHTQIADAIVLYTVGDTDVIHNIQWHQRLIIHFILFACTSKCASARFIRVFRLIQAEFVSLCSFSQSSDNEHIFKCV